MKFIWYNYYDVGAYVSKKRNTSGVGEGLLGSVEYKSLAKINELFSNCPWGMLHDISGHVAHPFNVLTRTPYQYRNYTQSFDQTCLAAAEQIAKSTDKPIAVNWSGGIDSTTALVALLQTVPVDRMRVVCNQYSIVEYPTFYQDIIRDRIETIDLADWPNRAAELFTVSGDAGDTVWGVIDDSFYAANKDCLHSSWKDWAVDRIGPNKMPTLEFVEEFCSWSGVEIRTVLDLRTWFYLCCKWQDKATKLFTDAPSNLGPKNLVPFYDADDGFMMWTMNNLDKIIGDSWTSYKVPAKQFIYKFHQDQDYLENKTKYNSVSMYGNTSIWKLLNQGSRFVIDEHYYHHTLPSWPFVDVHQFENWNNQHQLIPIGLVEQ